MENNRPTVVETRKKTLLISVISITLSLAFIFYLWNVFLAQFTMQNSVSDKPWLVSNSLGCDFRAYSLSPYANVPAKQGHREDANIWLLQTHRTVTYTSEILSNPKCLGARLADGATTNFARIRYSSVCLQEPDICVLSMALLGGNVSIWT